LAVKAGNLVFLLMTRKVRVLLRGLNPNWCSFG